LRPKRHDSINGIIAETSHYSQRLDAPLALRDARCGFFAASFLGAGPIFVQTGNGRRIRATSKSPGRHKYGCPVNPPVMKRLPESR
jgi:hypothetical protein